MSQIPLQDCIDTYAETILRVGLNLQPSQVLVIEAPIYAAPFVRVVTEYAFRLGAEQVHHEWSDDGLTRIRHLHAPASSLGYYPEWKVKGLEQYARENAAVLFIHAPNPDLLSDVPAEQIALEAQGRATIRRPFLEYTHFNRISWAIANVPSPAWASKSFPSAPMDEAMTKLWDIIFRATRTDSSNPIQRWEGHLSSLKARANQLNKLRIQKLHYRAPGTDLSVALPTQHKWMFGSRENDVGVPFVSNMPTEEVFTMPAKDGVNGIVHSTRPLNFNGTLIEDFSLTFKEGRVVECSAVKGEDVLKSILSTDKGACFLGEVALVPDHSPISQMEMVFYNTLFDENASCHLALGQSFSANLIGGTNMSPEDLELNGANSSMIHVDFMIGSAELNIDAELSDSSSIPLFRHGDWCN